jgi:deoxyribodipyrimidine photo-lyase
LVWFRRDLRLDDHAALAAAVAGCDEVVCAFVLDPVQLRGDRIGPPNVQFFFESLAELRAELRALGSDLALLEGDAAVVLPALARRIGADGLYFNLDVEPAARARDAAVQAAFERAGRSVASFIDHVACSPEDVRKPGGGAYTVFAPYKRRWLERCAAHPPLPFRSLAGLKRKLAPRASIGESNGVPSPESLGCAASPGYPRGGAREAKRLLAAFVEERIGRYDRDRNAPAIARTSR